jgi:hypothetical protein
MAKSTAKKTVKSTATKKVAKPEKPATKKVTAKKAVKKEEKKTAVPKKALTKVSEKETVKKDKLLKAEKDTVAKKAKVTKVEKPTLKVEKTKKADKEDSKKKGKSKKDDDEEVEPIEVDVDVDVVADTDDDDDVAPVKEVAKSSKRNKGKQPKVKTLTAVTMPTNYVIDENPVIERSISGRKSYKVEYTIKSSPAILFDFVTTPSGLVLWFADKVDINGDDITFTWNGTEENAIILEWIEEYRVRYRWEWMEEDEFFQFRIYKNEVTRDTILEITDFADEREIPDQIRLWDSQIKRLMQSIGS